MESTHTPLLYNTAAVWWSRRCRGLVGVVGGVQMKVHHNIPDPVASEEEELVVWRDRMCLHIRLGCDDLVLGGAGMGWAVLIWDGVE